MKEGKRDLPSVLNVSATCSARRGQGPGSSVIFLAHRRSFASPFVCLLRSRHDNLESRGKRVHHRGDDNCDSSGGGGGGGYGIVGNGRT